jgi:ribosomal protein L7/L12
LTTNPKGENVKTREEVEALKKNWLEDPCWDIEDTEGFEEFREELKHFSDLIKQEQDKMYALKLQKKAEELGITEHKKLVDYILGLEYRLEKLENEIA